MKIDEKTLNELKGMLLQEKKELEGNLNRIARPVNAKGGDYETSFDELGSDKEDNATEVDEYSQNVSVETTLEKRLQEIIEALEGIENGTYGKCENCDADIPIERLKVNPSAKTCLQCK
jgi:RNA polymerase-binding protein DksA